MQPRDSWDADWATVVRRLRTRLIWSRCSHRILNQSRLWRYSTSFFFFFFFVTCLVCCPLNETDRFSRQFPRDNNFLKVKRKFLLTIFFKDFPDVRFEVNFKIICLILQFLFFKILSAKVISNSFSRTFQKLLLTITRKTIEFNSVQRDSYSSHANCCTFENILWVRKQELHAYINSDKIPQLHSFQ